MHAPDLPHLLALSLTPGLGPRLTARLIERCGSAAAALGATSGLLETVHGIGPGGADRIARALRDAPAEAQRELERAHDADVALIPIGDERYPPLLAEIQDPPVILYVRGHLEPSGADRYPVAIVGSRRCTRYGAEQAVRFAGACADAGLCVVSGGARGIDAEAHRGALRARGRTIAVLGCGMEHVYPPEHAPIFDQIAEEAGAVISPFHMSTAPTSSNFPARNRVISGMSLGVLVVEAGAGSGALITARLAGDDHGREVFALPGRITDDAAMGCLHLIRDGALCVTSPTDVIAALEAPARHAHETTHQFRYDATPAEPTPNNRAESESGPSAFLSESQARIVACLSEPKTLDEVAAEVGLDAARLRVELTTLELRRLVSRFGDRLIRI